MSCSEKTLAGSRTASRFLSCLIAVSLFIWMSFEVVLGLLQLFKICDSRNIFFNVTGTFNNPGPYGCFLALVGVLVFTYYMDKLRSANKLINVIWGISMGACVFIIGLSFSRTAIVALILPIYVFVCRNKLFRSRTHIIIIILLLLVFIALLFFKRASAIGRIVVWKAELEAIRQNPLLGSGQGTVMGAYGKAIHSLWVDGPPLGKELNYPSYAFNEYFRIGIEHGLPVLFVSVVSLCLLFSYYWNNNPPFAYGLIAFSIISFASYPLSCWQFKVAGLLLLCPAANELVKQCVRRNGVLQYTLFSLLLSASLCIVYFAETTKNHNTAVLNQTMTLIDENRASDAIQYLHGHYIPAPIHNGACLYATGLALSQQGDLAMSQLVLNWALRYTSDPVVYILMGDNYLKLNNIEKAVEMFNTAKSIAPGLITARERLLDLYIETENTQEAKREAEELVQNKGGSLEAKMLIKRAEKYLKSIKTL